RRESAVGGSRCDSGAELRRRQSLGGPFTIGLGPQASLAATFARCGACRALLQFRRARAARIGFRLPDRTSCHEDARELGSQCPRRKGTSTHGGGERKLSHLGGARSE